MKMVIVKHKPGTITMGDIMETLEKQRKNPNLKISPEMQKSIDSINTMTDFILKPMLNYAGASPRDSRRRV